MDSGRPANNPVLESFLRDVLKVAPELAESDASVMENSLSDEAREKLSGFVAFLATDDPCVNDFLRAYGGHIDRHGV
jgi:Mn-dependent DtxR family transcriptional regulator